MGLETPRKERWSLTESWNLDALEEESFKASGRVDLEGLGEIDLEAPRG